jgi:hypothetical protein
MTGLEIAALVAAVAGAGVQYNAAREAQARMEAETRRSLENQRRLQMQAEKKALDTAANYETPKRQAEQAQIAEQITQELIAPVSESQAIRQGQQTTQGNVSEDYLTAKAASDLNTLKQAEQMARLLGKTTSASRLRMNEGIRLMDAGMDVDRLNNFSRGQAWADQIAINAAGQVDPGQMFLGALLQAGGSAGLAGGFGGKTTPFTGGGLKATASPTGFNLASPSGGLGLRPTGGVGLKPGILGGF